MLLYIKFIPIYSYQLTRKKLDKLAVHKHNIGRSHIKIPSTGELISFSPMAQAVRRIVGTMSTFTRLHRGCLFHTTIFGLHGSSHIVCLDPTDKNVILTEPPRGWNCY